MKFGLLYHNSTCNFENDIQTYAVERFLPHVDYLLDPEHPDVFASQNGEPVAVVMSGWWMSNKWNWPPASCICPLLTGMHFNRSNPQKNLSPLTGQWIKSGPGQEYLTAYGPVGCQDTESIKFLRKYEIDAFFSGSIALTLPKQKETSDKGKYVVLAELDDTVRDRMREWLKDSDLEIREIHSENPEIYGAKDAAAATRETISDEDFAEATANMGKSTAVPSWKERSRQVQELLVLYQNARFVITGSRQSAFSCLAMEVPVIAVTEEVSASAEEDGKVPDPEWQPYQDWFFTVTKDEVTNGKFKYKFQNPLKNPGAYLETRNHLIHSVSEFVKKMDDMDCSLEEIRKTTYSEMQLLEFRNELRHTCCELWLSASRGVVRRYRNAEKKLKISRKTVKKNKKEIASLKNGSYEFRPEDVPEKPQKTPSTDHIEKAEAEQSKKISKSRHFFKRKS